MIIYKIGRLLQLIGLGLTPFSMWVAHFEKSEPKSIGILVGSIVVFTIGYFFTVLGKRL